MNTIAGKKLTLKESRQIVKSVWKNRKKFQNREQIDGYVFDLVIKMRGEENEKKNRKGGN